MIAHWIPMTPEGYREMREELEALKLQAAPRTPGGAHPGLEGPGSGPDPNPGSGADGDAADALLERILALEEKIQRAQVIEGGQRDRVRFGAVVEVRNRDGNSVSEYALVGPEELDPESGRISPASPIGRALMGRRVGDTVSLQVPRGELRLEILAIR